MPELPMTVSPGENPARSGASRLMIGRRRWLLLAIEIAWVVLFSLYVGRHFLNFDQTYRIHGREMEWIASPVAWMAHIWQQDGYIPRWMPYVSLGQPSVDHGHSMLFNPLASIPALIFGINSGTKLSVVLFLILGGAGGLVLGRTLNWGFPARLLLAGLLIARSSTLMTFGFGYIQMAAQQMYFPWVMAGIIGLAKGRHARRYVALIAISLSQTFLAGNVYHILPETAIACTLAVMLAIRFRPHLQIDGLQLRRTLLAFAFAAGLMAVTALSTLVLFQYVRDRDISLSGQTQELGLALQQYFVPDILMSEGVEENNRYVFVTPWWLAVLLFALLPPIPRLLYRSRNWWIDSRLWLLLIVGFFFFVTMGIGINPISTWLWSNVSLLGQWRFLERMLTVAGFLLAVLVCLRFDGLWYALETRLTRQIVARRSTALVKAGMAGLAACAVIAPLSVEATRMMDYALEQHDPNLAACLEAIASAQAVQPAAVQTSLYVSIWPYYETGVRLASFQADYDQAGRPHTLFQNDLTHLDAPYYLPYGEDTRDRLAAGYRPAGALPGCSWTPDILFKPGAVPYAFSAPVRIFETDEVEQVEQHAAPVEMLLFEPERNILRAENLTDEPVAVVAQTIAYPGWEASINGNPAQLESVGQLLGVILPAHTPPSIIEFSYRPATFLIGGLITLVTSVVLIGYLLRVDERVRRWWEKPTPAPAPEIAVIPAGEASAPLAAGESEAAPETRRPWRGAITGVIVTVGATVALAGALLAGWLLRGQRNRRE